MRPDSAIADGGGGDISMLQGPLLRRAVTATVRDAVSAELEGRKKNVSKSVLALPDDHYLSYKSVKKWIKTQQEIARSERRNMVKGIKGAAAKMYAAQGYVNQMNHYIQHGDWCCDYYGEYEEKRIIWKTIAPNEEW